MESLCVVRCSRSRGGFATTFNARSADGGLLLVKVSAQKDPEGIFCLRREYQLQRRASALDGRFPRPFGFVESLSASGPDCGCVRGRPAILMERICGPTLRELVDAGHYLSEAQGERVARDLLGQIRTLAELGYCHHDVTPSNVMLDVGMGAAARLIDLGVASRLTLDDGVRVRSPYQRPEELRRPQGTPPSPLTDLYGVAAVLRESCWGDMVSSGRPLPRTGFAEWVGRVLADGFGTPGEALEAL